MTKWVCSVCGYVYEGEKAPEACPVCKAPADKFVKQDGEMSWAAEHVVGVAQGSSEDIMADLRANFQGECSEVGMYLAMARVAHREGYPEIGLYYEKAAYEEAIVKLLDEHQIDLVCLAGYMKIVGPTLLAAYEGRIINIHPAYLPEFPGAHGIEDAWNAGVDQSGVTIHWVDSGVDTGKVIKQVRVPRLEGDTLDTFETRIHETEYKLYPEVLERLGVERR